jgi:dolichol-phosphate mannosyltransferase
VKKKISIIIPIFNEKKNILKLLQEIKRNLKEFKYEVIFVDDNSEDGSIEILKKIKFIDKRFDYVLHDGPRDLTQSCFQGISIAKNNLIVIMDGDLQHNPTYIKPLFYKLVQDKADLVIGSRDFENIKKNSLSFVRLTFSKILIITLKILSGKKYLDPMSGFFLFKKKIFTNNKKLFYGKGYKILADFIYNIPNIKVSEIIIKFRSRRKGSSKMSLEILILLLIFMITKVK